MSLFWVWHGACMKQFAAIFTVVKDEGVLLDVWLRYYSKFFEKIFVIDHHTTDDSITRALEKYSFVCEKDDRGVDRGSRLREGDSDMGAVVASEFLARLLPDFEVVCHAHIDEFLVPDPDKYKDLRDYMEKNNKPIIYSTGYQVIHLKDEEPDMDFSKPMLSQRKWWTKDHAYNKPLILRKAIQWAPGIHKEVGVNDGEMETINDPDLLMIHVHFADYKLFTDRSQYSGEMNWFLKYHKDKTEIPEKFKNIV